MSDKILMKIKDAKGGYSGSYNEHGIKGALLLCNNSYLPMFSKNEYDEVIGEFPLSFSINYEDPFYETLQKWSTSSDEVKAVRIAEVNLKSDTQNPGKKIPLLVREIQLFNVYVTVNLNSDSRIAVISFSVLNSSKSGENEPGLTQKYFLATEKSSQASNELYVNLLTMKSLTAAHISWETEEIEEIIK
jgi:hypothetical protein